MELGSRQVHVTPIAVEIQGCIVYILEVLKNEAPDGTNWYHVVCRVKCGSVESKTFDISVRNTKELIAKLRTEIAKLKLIKLTLGEDFARRVIG